MSQFGYKLSFPKSCLSAPHSKFLPILHALIHIVCDPRAKGILVLVKSQSPFLITHKKLKPTLFCVFKFECTSIELALSAPTSSPNCSVSICCASFSRSTFSCRSRSIPSASFAPPPFPTLLNGSGGGSPGRILIGRGLPTMGPGAGGALPERAAPARVLPLALLVTLVLVLVLMPLPVGRLPSMALNRRNSCFRAERMRSRASTRKL